jgi:hypothetical protein
MRHLLLLHPDFRATAVERIEAEVLHSPTGLAVRYLVIGDMHVLKLPLPSGSTRADELWRHTCFELFLRAADHNNYYEFNFSPSLEWAAYRFADYRQGMELLETAAPRIELRQDAGTFELRAELSLEGTAETDGDAEWSVGLSAVIEETNGNVSYFALAHAPGKPDFHRADGFALSILVP